MRDVARPSTDGVAGEKWTVTNLSMVFPLAAATVLVA
jgi:hypothetical protein